MYTIPLNDNSKEIDVLVTRSLLSLAGITAFFYRVDEYIVVNISIAILLLGAAFAARYLLLVVPIKKVVLLVSAGVLLFVATHAITFSLLLVAFGMLSSFIYKKPFVLLKDDAVIIRSSKGSASYEWSEFENIVLKDNLLTIDFKNNRLLQLDVTVDEKQVDEEAFNNFCDACILGIRK